jgi:hypothetical protein
MGELAMTTETAFTRTLTSDSNPWSGYTLRIRIPAAQLTKPTSTPTFINVLLSAGNAENTIVGAAYIGHAAASGYSFASTPTAITIGAAANFTLAAGTSTRSDNLSFVYDGTSDLIVSAYFNGGTGSDNLRWMTSGGNCSLGFKNASDAGTVTATGYSNSSSNPNVCALVSDIQMDGYTGGGGGGTPTSFEVVGVIRNTGSGWSIIDDVDHTPLNITSISTTNGASTTGFVTITYGKTAGVVGTLLISPDELYAQNGTVAGASVGLSSANIYFGKNGVAVSPNSVSSASGNFWIYGKMFA